MSISSIGSVSGNSQASTTAVTTQKPDASTGTTGVSAASNGASQNKDNGSHLQVAIDKLRKAAEASGSNLEFSLDKDSGKTVVKVVDQATGNLVRQIPSQDLLDIASSVEKMQGLLFKKEA